jgi:hypothetical protein
MKFWASKIVPANRTAAHSHRCTPRCGYWPPCAVRSIREHGGEPSSHQVDALLDERIVNLRGANEDVAVDT